MALLSSQQPNSDLPPLPPGFVPEPPMPAGFVPETQAKPAAPAAPITPPQSFFAGSVDDYGRPVFDLTAKPPAPPPMPAGFIPEQSLTATPWTPWGRTQAAFSEGVHGSFLGRAADYLATQLAPGTVPVDPNTGQPMNAPSPREQVRSTIGEEQAQTALRPSGFDEPTLGGKIVGVGSEIAGTLAGGMLSPESMVAGPEGYGAVRAGEAFLPTLLKSAGVQAGVQGAADVAGQGLAVAGGNQDQFDWGELARATAMGGVFGAAPVLAGKGVNLLRGPRDIEVRPPGEAAPAVPETPAVEAVPKPGEAPPVPPPPETPPAAEVPPAPAVTAETPAAAVETPPTPEAVASSEATPLMPPGFVPEPEATPPMPAGFVPEGETPSERTVAPAPAERPAGAPLVGAEDTGRVQPEGEPGSAGGEGATVGGEAGAAPGVERTPGPEERQAAPEARTPVEQAQPGEAAARTGSEELAAGARPDERPAVVEGEAPVRGQEAVSEAPKVERAAETERVSQDTEKPAPKAEEPEIVRTSRTARTEPTEFLEREAVQDTRTAGRTRAIQEAQENVGASPFREVLRDAGHDPDAAVQLPIEHQARIVRDQTRDTFGFRDVTSTQKHIDTVNQLSNFYQNAKAYAHVRGIPYEAVGLHGRLAMDLRPMTAKTGYLGVYHPGSKTIGLPGRTNSFAHERAHAVDHYLAEVTRNNPKARKLLSETTALYTGPHQANTTAEAHAKVIGALYGKHGNDALDTLALQHRALAGDKLATFELLRRETDYAKNAREYGDAHGGEDLARYYYRPSEMLARADEAYTAHLVEVARQDRLIQGHEAPFDTRAISKPEHIYSAEGAQAIHEAFAKLYPKAEEREHIFEALRQRDEQMTADHILGPGPPGDLPSSRDMVSPANWSKMANTNSKKAGILRQEINAYRNLGDTIRDRMGMDPTRPPAPHSWWTRNVTDPGGIIVNRIAANLETLVHRAPAAAQPHLLELMDHVSPATRIRTAEAAKGRYLGPVYEEDVKEWGGRNTHKYEKIMKANDLEKMTAAEKLQFHQVMSGRIRADDPGVDPRIKTATSQLRFPMTDEYTRAIRAGIDMGFAPEAYFPRTFDSLKIQHDPIAFEKGAVKSYGPVFDRDTARGQNREALIKHALELRGDQHDTLRGDARRLQRMGSERDEIVKRLADGTSPDVQADHARLAQLDQDMDSLHRTLVPDVRDTWVKQSGEDLKNYHLFGGPTDYFDTRGPASTFTKGRVFTPEADEHLRDFMITDPDQAIPAYFEQSARYIASAEHFGIKDKNGKLAGNLIDENLRQAGELGMSRPDQDMFRGYIEAITGRNRSNVPGGLERAGNAAHAILTMGMMTRSMFSSLGEPAAIYARTGNARATLTALANQIGDMFGTAGSAQRREYAEAISAIRSPYHDSIWTARYGSHYENDPRWNRVTMWYYRRIGQTGLTNSQTQSGVDGARFAMKAWAEHLLSPKTSRLAERNRYEAAAQFRDLGITDADQKVMAEYAMSLGRNRRAQVADLETEGGALYGRAVTRLIHEAIQDPLRVNKPLLSTHPMGRFAFGLMAFNYSFFHNIVIRTFQRYWDRVADAEGIGKLGEIGRAGGHLAAASGAIYAGSMLATIAREAIFNPTKWDEMDKEGKLWEWLSDLAVQRTGINGPLDPIQQAITGLRYEKSFTGILAGAQIGYLLNAVEKVARPLIQQSPHTNTADYNALRGIYDGLLVPAETLALTALPGGPLTSKLWGAAMMGGTSPGASDWFAQQFVGPKGSKERPPPGTLPGLPKPPGQKAAPLPGLPKPGTSTTGDTTIPSGSLGFADDVAVPILRLMMRLPGPVKWGAAGLGALGVGSLLADEFGRFQQPDQ